jgi:hypothetical protein
LSQCDAGQSQCDAGQQDELLQLPVDEVDPHVQGVGSHVHGVGQHVPGSLGSTNVIVHVEDRWTGPTSVSLQPVETASMTADSHKKCLIAAPFTETHERSCREWCDVQPRARER